MRPMNTNKQVLSHEQNPVSSCGFPLSRWIDIKSGRVLGNDYELVYALQSVTSRIFNENQVFSAAVGTNSSLPSGPMPPRPADYPVDYAFSEEVIRSIVEVYPGIDMPDSESRDVPVNVESLTLGRFKPYTSAKKPKTGQITLYTAAIAEYCASNGLDYETVFWAVLARESFHAVHFDLFKAAGKQRRWNRASDKKSREIVKQSLAAHYEYFFLIRNEGGLFVSSNASKLRDHLERSWRNYDVDSWPCAGALGIGGPCVSQVRHSDITDLLLKKSLSDWKTAADIIKTGYYLTDYKVRKMLDV